MLNNCRVLFCKWSHLKKSYRWQSSWLWNSGFCLLALRWWCTHRCPSRRASPREATDCSSLQIWPYDAGWGTSSCSPPCLSWWCPGLSRCEAVQKHTSGPEITCHGSLCGLLCSLTLYHDTDRKLMLSRSSLAHSKTACSGQFVWISWMLVVVAQCNNSSWGNATEYL